LDECFFKALFSLNGSHQQGIQKQTAGEAQVFDPGSAAE